MLPPCRNGRRRFAARKLGYVNGGTVQPRTRTSSRSPFSPNRLHEQPVAFLSLVRIVVGIARVSVPAVAVGPMVFLSVGMLRSAVIRIIDGIHAPDVIGKFVRRATRSRAAARGSRGLQLTVDGGYHGTVV